MWNKKNVCNVIIMPHKSDKAPASILECSIKKDGCKNNPIKLSATYVGKHLVTQCLQYGHFMV